MQLPNLKSAAVSPNTSFLSFICPAIIFITLLAACGGNSTEQPQTIIDSATAEKNYIKAIPGKNDTLPEADVQRGKVLIAYSDCYTCHRENDRAKGPAFKDIAKRYPVNDGYIELLAQKVIIGGSGAWGYPVMSPHPDLPLEDVKTMVKYILSLKE